MIYGIGLHVQQRELITDLWNAAASRGWSVVDICFDPDDSLHSSARPGLRAALERLRSGAAAALVLDERDYRSIRDCLWLKIAVQIANGALYPVSIESVAGRSVPTDERASRADAVARFLSVVRPVGLCQEDVG